MNGGSEDKNTSHASTSSAQSVNSPTLSDTHSETSNFLGSDQATLSGGSYHSIDSSDTNTFFAHTLAVPRSTTMSSTTYYNPPPNTSAPNASVLEHLTKLSTGNYIAWKRDLEIHLDACGLGTFITSTIPDPTAVSDVPLWRMHRVQVLLAIRTTIDGHNLNAISGANRPHDVIMILSRRHRHGENVGLAAPNLISAIVFQKFDALVSIKEFVSNTQLLHKKLAELTTNHPEFSLSDQILALLLVIKLPRNSFNSILQQLLSDLKSLTTNIVFDRLLRESQSMKPTADDSAVALAVQGRVSQHQK